jgi:hypothetical protein
MESPRMVGIFISGDACDWWSSGKLGNDDIMTLMSDRLQSDDHDIIYRFYPGNEGYQLITRHLFEENTTMVRIFKGESEEWAQEVFEW